MKHIFITSVLALLFCLIMINEGFSQNYTSAAPTIFSDKNFDGKYQTLELKFPEWKQHHLKLGNDAVVSIKIPKGKVVELYEHNNFKGKKVVLYESAKSLGSFNKKTSSIKIVSANPEGPFVTLQTSSGAYQKLDVKIYLTWYLRHLGIVEGQQVSHVGIPQGYEIYLYPQDDFKGTSKKLSEGIHRVYMKVASVKVKKVNSSTASILSIPTSPQNVDDLTALIKEMDEKSSTIQISGTPKQLEMQEQQEKLREAEKQLKDVNLSKLEKLVISDPRFVVATNTLFEFAHFLAKNAISTKPKVNRLNPCTVWIKTKDAKSAGTNSNIFLKIIGSKGVTKEYRLNEYIGGNAFERGDDNKIHFSTISDIGTLQKITIRSDGKLAGSDWLLETVTINLNGKKRTANYGKWISKETITLYPK